MQEDIPKAKKALEQALSLVEERLNPGHRIIITISWDLSRVYEHEGNFDKALALAERTRSLEAVYLGENHGEVASSLSRIGNLHKHLGQFDNALQRLQQAREMLEKPDANAGDLVEVYARLAQVFEAQVRAVNDGKSNTLSRSSVRKQ